MRIIKNGTYSVSNLGRATIYTVAVRGFGTGKNPIIFLGKLKKHVVCDKRLIEEECREVLKVSYARRDYMRAGRKVYLIESATVQRFHRTKKN
jgi:hypothetical protein